MRRSRSSSGNSRSHPATIESQESEVRGTGTIASKLGKMQPGATVTRPAGSDAAAVDARLAANCGIIRYCPNAAHSSFPCSAWECRLRRSASSFDSHCVLVGGKRATIRGSPTRHSQTTRSVEDGIPTEDRGNEVSRTLDQQAGLIRS